MFNKLGDFSYQDMQEQLHIKEIKLRKGSRYTKLNSTKIVDELKVIQDIYGNIDAENVVDYARTHKDSEFYKGLEWNNDVAAEIYRKQQVHQIICDIEIVYENTNSVNTNEFKTFEIQAYSHIDSLVGYKSTIEILSNDDTRKELIHKALNELIYWQEKYKSIVEFSAICKDIDDLVSNF